MSDNKSKDLFQQKDQNNKNKSNTSLYKKILPWEVRFIIEATKKSLCDLVGIKYKEPDEKKFHM